MINGSIYQKDITFGNTYAANIGAPRYIKQILTALKGETDSNTTTIGDLDGQKAHEEMLNIINYQRNTNQNHSEVSPHTGENGHHQKLCKR